MCDSLELVYTYYGISATTSWDRIWTLICKEQPTERMFDVYEHTMEGRDVLEFLRGRAKEYFLIKWQNCEFRLSQVGRHDLSFLCVKWNKPRTVEVWETWVEALSKTEAFVSARLFDSDYEKWQNADDPLEYEAAGRSYEDLPMKSNDLPPPLDREIIDTSNNTGRRVLQIGFIEAIGAVMWLGPTFVERTELDLSNVRNLSNVRVTRESSRILKVMTGERCFSQADGREAVLQQMLRRILFSTSAGQTSTV